MTKRQLVLPIDLTSNTLTRHLELSDYFYHHTATIDTFCLKLSYRNFILVKQVMTRLSDGLAYQYPSLPQSPYNLVNSVTQVNLNHCMISLVKDN